MKRDLVIGATSGYSFDQIKYWLNSLDRSGFAGERVILVGNGDDALVRELESRGCLVIPRAALVDSIPGLEPKTFSDEDSSVERHLWTWKYLTTRAEEDIRYVIAVDMRDAVFQLDPSAWLDQHLGNKRLVVAGEGIRYADQPWNRQNLYDAFGPFVLHYLRRHIVWNGGALAGDFKVIRDLALNVFLCSDRLYADQASLNVLLSLSPYHEWTLFDEGDSGWACQAATMARDGQGSLLSHRFLGREPLFDGDRVYACGGLPFCIVHQYDRVPSWKRVLEQKFG